ncbi:DUF615 domain-containing protein [Legionella israelensis]|uniref:Dual-action ribosomal maturation protein DarP n=1 Tax=Legionella israelensis TaxID=454 RepID=A0A0W0V4C8_9GAMM|nr:ribosome biogenesis factor YjgA [Legionella israelensis]KTD14954.1 alpha helix protein [Legionella israelensis]QBR83055.1 DUF615 domain-containing protein [Legionella israelensis]QBS09581.1 DUF615 domain-containing protein [Legionella israelensis]QDP71587.1 DUF615 domain-containing protein [Legionella israelensis]SCY23579.1 ribosome-associated protein [Legionella israelensis DSM 19235]
MEQSKSKTQKKQEVERLQKLGVDMIKLSDGQLEQLLLPEVLKKAIIDARSIKSHGAKRRQAQLIGKLMRAADSEAIIAAYNELLAEGKAKTAAFHEAERWRERLLTEGSEALTEFIHHHHPDDIQHLRQLVKKAIDEQQKGKNTGASKTLFRYLRLYIQ